MNQPLQTADYSADYAGYGGQVTSQEQRNRVLRNTYWLLALSMVPTVLGAWIGVTRPASPAAMGPGMSAIVFLVGCLRFDLRDREDQRTLQPACPILLGFTFFMGLMLVAPDQLRCWASQDGAGLIMTAFAGTGVIFLGMATLSTVIKRDLSVDGQVPVHRPDHADRRGDREHLPAVERADDHALGRRDRHLLCLHRL